MPVKRLGDEVAVGAVFVQRARRVFLIQAGHGVLHRLYRFVLGQPERLIPLVYGVLLWNFVYVDCDDLRLRAVTITGLAVVGRPTHGRWQRGRHGALLNGRALF